jgi:hypothetical protein
MELLEFLVVHLSKSEKVWPIEELAKMYVTEEGNISQDSIDFSTQLVRAESSIKRIIKQQNDRYIKDGMTAPFLVKGTSHNLLTKTNVLEILEESLTSLEENPHAFADRVGREVLRRIGCAEEKIRLTQKSRDAGIDYWGELELCGMPFNLPHRILIIGQVKMNTGSTPVSDLREFVGAVKTALAINHFGINYNEHSPNIMHFVTTGELTSEGENIARIFNIQVFKRRHLIDMSLLKPE